MGVSRRLSSMILLSGLVHAGLLLYIGGARLEPDMGSPADTRLSVALVAPAQEAESATSQADENDGAANAAAQDAPHPERTHAMAHVVRRAPAPTPPLAANQAVTDAPSSPSTTADASVAPASTELSAVERISQAVRRRFQAQFDYPWVARKRNWQGDVVLALHIEGDGRLSRVALDSSSGYSALDDSALKSALRIGRIPEATPWLDGAACDLTLPVRYRLTDG